jgi:predicted nucleic acid-binding protein
MLPSAKKFQGDMIAVDTNVVVRLLTGDDPKQTMAAQSILLGTDLLRQRVVLVLSFKTSLYP